jgi:hypothetical protein
VLPSWLFGAVAASAAGLEIGIPDAVWTGPAEWGRGFDSAARRRAFRGFFRDIVRDCGMVRAQPNRP